MSTNQPRKPAGTPASGQWAPTQHNEVDIVLDVPVCQLADQGSQIEKTTISKVSVGQEVSYIERGKAVLGFHRVATVEHRTGIGYVLHCEDGFTVEGGSATKVFVR